MQENLMINISSWFTRKKLISGAKKFVYCTVLVEVLVHFGINWGFALFGRDPSVSFAYEFDELYETSWSAYLSVLAFGLVLWIILVMFCWLFRNTDDSHKACESCGYPMLGIDNAEKCPECGKEWNENITKSS